MRPVTHLIQQRRNRRTIRHVHLFDDRIDQKAVNDGRRLDAERLEDLLIVGGKHDFVVGRAGRAERPRVKMKVSIET